jgi:hypothetical protein
MARCCIRQRDRKTSKAWAFLILFTIRYYDTIMSNIYLIRAYQGDENKAKPTGEELFIRFCNDNRAAIVDAVHTHPTNGSGLLSILVYVQ